MVVVLFVLLAALCLAVVYAWNRYVSAKDALVYPNTRHVFERGAAHGIILAMLLSALGGSLVAVIKVIF